MNYFELARSRHDYSLAFKEYRKEYIREHFAGVSLAVILLFVLLRFGIPFARKRLSVWLSARVNDKSAAGLKGGATHDRNV
ncbi:hypothetical protein D3C77_773470 [compost metagenome]